MEAHTMFLKLSLVSIVMLSPLSSFAESLMSPSSDSSKDAKSSETLYHADFEKTKIDEYPMDILLLSGDFSVQQDGDNRVLRLPGRPLNNFKVLFGPAQQLNVRVQASIRGESTKRRYPEFGLGLNGVSGYRILVAPQRRALELYKGQELQASEALSWKSGTWIQLALQTQTIDASRVKVSAKIWKKGEQEPKEWNLEFEDQGKPIKGRAVLWAAPFSSKPIDFDDLLFTSPLNTPLKLKP